MSKQQNPEPQSPDPKALKEALDKSSSINRTLGLSFSLFLFIIAIMVAGTTDMQLFIPDSAFTFPFVNLPLSIKYFFIAAPFVVLIMHYNLLYNLQQHSKKLLRLGQNTPGSQNAENGDSNANEQESLLMFPFLFNFALTVQNPLHSLALNLVIRITVFMLPLALLFFILIRFADYQSMTISSWHFAAVLLDMALIATHSRSIIKVIKTRSDEVSDVYGWRDFFSFRRGKPRVIVFSVNALKFAIHIIPAALSVVAASIIYVAGNVYSLLTRLKFRKRIFFTKTLDYLSLVYKFLRLELIIAWLAVAYFGFFIYIMNVYIEREKAHEGLISYIIPRLSLPEEVLVKSQPIEHLKTLYLNTSLTPEERNKKEQEIMLKFTDPHILQGRSFRYADLSETILTRSDLRGADLSGAMLEDSQMQEARLLGANLQGAVLMRAELQGANFERAKLQGANLWIANLQQANLRNAVLQGANLSFANLQGADLINANLQGADLRAANLQGADLINAKLQRAHLLGAKLQGADLRVANLQGAILMNANLQGANFERGKLQGANFERGKLQGAVLMRAELQGAVLMRAELQGADLREANLKGANLETANIQGLIFDDIRLKGTLFSDLSVDTVLLFNERDETKDIFLFDFEIDAIRSLFQDELLKRVFKERMNKARNRFHKDTLTLVEKIPFAKIYRPEEMVSDSSFFFIRRRIAAQNKDVAQRMLESVRLGGHTIYHSLYSDLYRFLKYNHPDYLRGFEYDERGWQIRTNP